MLAQKLTAFEQAVVTGLVDKAGFSVALLAAWADLRAGSEQATRSLVEVAQ